jgi:hypothetical protein
MNNFKQFYIESLQNWKSKVKPIYVNRSDTNLSFYTNRKYAQACSSIDNVIDLSIGNYPVFSGLDDWSIDQIRSLENKYINIFKSVYSTDWTPDVDKNVSPFISHFGSFNQARGRSLSLNASNIDKHNSKYCGNEARIYMVTLLLQSLYPKFLVDPVSIINRGLSMKLKSGNTDFNFVYKNTISEIRNENYKTIIYKNKIEGVNQGANTRRNYSIIVLDPNLIKWKD